MTSENDEDEEEDEFVTPDSSPGAQTPPRNPSQPNITVSQQSQSQAVGEEVKVSENLVKKKMYDRYKMSMNGMQVRIFTKKGTFNFAVLKMTLRFSFHFL